jgi:hypothetical protein
VYTSIQWLNTSIQWLDTSIHQLPPCSKRPVKYMMMQGRKFRRREFERDDDDDDGGGEVDRPRKRSRVSDSSSQRKKIEVGQVFRGEIRKTTT